MSSYYKAWVKHNSPLSFDAESYTTLTSIDQCSCEKDCLSFLLPLELYDEETKQKLLQSGLSNSDFQICLLKEKHKEFLLDSILDPKTFEKGYISLEVSRGWILFWITHALSLLKSIPFNLDSRIATTIKGMENEKHGGYSNGNAYLSHGAPNFGTVFALLSLGKEYFSDINRNLMYKFFFNNKRKYYHHHSSCLNSNCNKFCPNISSGLCSFSTTFYIHKDGECDTRAIYTVLAVSRALNILTEELIDSKTYPSSVYEKELEDEKEYRELLKSKQFEMNNIFKTLNSSSEIDGVPVDETNREEVQANFLSKIIKSNELVDDNVSKYIEKCQTFEGGIADEGQNEAHGGYTYCGVAAYLILLSFKRELMLKKLKESNISLSKETQRKLFSNSNLNKLNLNLLQHWLINRQMRLEGGFQGRTNKLVDSCYSFWQAGGLACLNILKIEDGDDFYDAKKYFIYNKEMSGNYKIISPHNSSDTSLFNTFSLQKYILHCGQDVTYGGLKDKPSKRRDHYHTCYALSGLSLAQWSGIVHYKSKFSIEKISEFILNETEDETNVSNDLLELDNSLDDLIIQSEEYKKAQDLYYRALEYCNSAFSSTQNENDNIDVDDIISPDSPLPFDVLWRGPHVYGDPGNLIEPTSCVFNITLDKLLLVKKYFYKFPCSHQELFN